MKCNTILLIFNLATIKEIIMKKTLLITILFLSTAFYQGFAENNISSSISKPVAANMVGHFVSGGVEYSVWVYLPSTTITRISWQVVIPPNTYNYISPSVSGSYVGGQSPSTGVTFIDANGNNTTYIGDLYW